MNPSKAELLEARIYRFLRDYRLSNMTCEGTTDNFYPLVDAVSHPTATDISNGEDELRRIASELAAEILPDEPAPSPTKPEGLELVTWEWRSRIMGGAWDAWERGRYGQEVPPFMDVEERALYALSPVSDADTIRVAADDSWPPNPWHCAHKNSCMRHRQCMYIGCVHNTGGKGNG